MASSVILNQVFLETSTAKSIKIRFTNVTDNTGQAISVWLPRSQIIGNIPDMYTIGNLGITGWFWNKVKEKIDIAPGTLESDMIKNGTTIPVAQPMKPLYEILRLKTPADAKEFIKGLAKFFDDPVKFERYLQGNIIPMSGMIRMSIDIDVKNLLLSNLDDFKEELIQSGLQEYFKDKM